MSAESRKELFTRRVSAGSRTYFFDVKQSAEGAKYLLISESRDVKGKWEHDRVMVFEVTVHTPASKGGGFLAICA